MESSEAFTHVLLEKYIISVFFHTQAVVFLREEFVIKSSKKQYQIMNSVLSLITHNHESSI